MDALETYHIKPGDVIVKPIFGGLFKHLALYLGFIDGVEWIIQNTAKVGIVHCVEASAFLSTLPVGSYVIAHDFDEVVQQEIIERALTVQGTSYDIFNFNCEQFVNYALWGTSWSGQVANSLLLGAAGGLLLYANRKK
jgi:hypothetical protein